MRLMVRRVENDGRLDRVARMDRTIDFLESGAFMPGVGMCMSASNDGDVLPWTRDKPCIFPLLWAKALDRFGTFLTWSCAAMMPWRICVSDRQLLLCRTIFRCLASDSTSICRCIGDKMFSFEVDKLKNLDDKYPNESTGTKTPKTIYNKQKIEVEMKNSIRCTQNFL